jgi:hypothetical protein
MFAPRANLIPPQRQRPIAPPQTSIHPTRIAELRAGLAAPPHASAVRVTVRALRRARRDARIGVGVVLVVLVRCDERRGSHFVALLEVEPARVTQRAVRRGVAPPERRGRRVAVRAGLPARGTVNAAAPRGCQGLAARRGVRRGWRGTG